MKTRTGSTTNLDPKPYFQNSPYTEKAKMGDSIHGCASIYGLLTGHVSRKENHRLLRAIRDAANAGVTLTTLPAVMDKKQMVEIVCEVVEVDVEEVEEVVWLTID